MSAESRAGKPKARKSRQSQEVNKFKLQPRDARTQSEDDELVDKRRGFAPVGGAKNNRRVLSAEVAGKSKSKQSKEKISQTGLNRSFKGKKTKSREQEVGLGVVKTRLVLAPNPVSKDSSYRNKKMKKDQKGHKKRKPKSTRRRNNPGGHGVGTPPMYKNDEMNGSKKVFGAPHKKPFDASPMGSKTPDSKNGMNSLRPATIRRTYMDQNDDDVVISDKEKDKDAGNEKEEEPEKTTDIRRSVVKAICKAGIKGLIKEFAQLKKVVPTEQECVEFIKNEVRNRYADVMCLDNNRVILKARQSDDDYIHANFVSFNPKETPHYICAQGPTEETITDFWHMVYSEDVEAIVMLCQFVEKGAEKCAEYYQTEAGTKQNCGEYVVLTATCDTIEHNVVVRKLMVQHRSGAAPPKSVTHFLWPDWPDHLAPLSTDPVLHLLKSVKQHAGEKLVVVHCSAGIGRTGTFVAIDYFNEKLKNSSKPTTIIELCKSFRCQRAHVVQSLVQYLYLHVALVKLSLEDKILKEDSEYTTKFLADYKKYINKLMEKHHQDASVVKPLLQVIKLDQKATFEASAYNGPDDPSSHRPHLG